MDIPVGGMKLDDAPARATHSLLAFGAYGSKFMVGIDRPPFAGFPVSSS